MKNRYDLKKSLLFTLLLVFMGLANSAYAQKRYPISIVMGYVTDNTTAHVTLANGDEVDNVFAYRGFYVGSYYNYAYCNVGLQVLFEPLHHKGTMPLGQYAPSSQVLLEMPITTPKLGFRIARYYNEYITYYTLIAARVGVAPSYNFSVSSDFGGMNQFDVKLLGFVSVDFSKIGFEVGIRKGLLDLDKHGSPSSEIDEIKTKTFGLTFGVTYTF